MSNPKVRNIIIVSAVMVVLIVACVLVNNNNKKKESREQNKKNEETVEENISVYSIASNEIKKIDFKKGELADTFNYSEEEDAWTLSNHNTWTLNQSKIDDILSALSAITATKKIDKPDDLKVYELDNPSLSVTIVNNSDEEYKFSIGCKNPAGKGYYFKEDGKDIVYVIDTAVFDAFDNELNQYIAVEEIPAVTSNNIYSMDITKADGSKVLSYYYDGDKTDTSVAGNWYVTAPFATTLKGNETNIYSYQTNYASLKYEECVDLEPADLSVYGLDNPAYTINFKHYEEETEDSESEEKKDPVITHKEVTYYIGNPIMGHAEDDSNPMYTVEASEDDELTEVSYYVYSSQTKGVFKMAADVVKVLTQVDTMSFADTHINDKDLSYYDNMTLTYGGNTYVCKKIKEVTKDDDGNEIINYKYTVNDKELSVQDGEGISEGLSNLIVKKPITEQVADETEVAKLVYTGAEGVYTVTIKPYNDSFYRTNINGAEYFLVDKYDLEGVLNKIVKLSK